MTRILPLLTDFDLHKAGLLLSACQDAYAKHHMGIDTIGWDELGEHLELALSQAMGVSAVLDWAAQTRREGERNSAY